jgi:hypothetical protein
LPRIAITGHMNVTSASVPLIYAAVTKALAIHAQQGELVGVSCIARGADSIFARAVLDAGGKLEVILPSTNYRTQKVKPDHAAQFDDLINHATTVRVLPFDVANRVAYEAANEALLSACDRLFAVWDGQAGVDKGSTASVVTAARSRGVPVDVIWPDGAARD